MRVYYELWVAFARIDTGKDKKVSKTELLAAKPLLEKWGIYMSNPDQQFKEADKDESGQILFIEFCDWAIKRNLDLDDDDDDDKDV